MAGAIGTQVVKDGNGTAIVGGVRMFDVSGTGAGPWVPVSLLYDPTSGQFGTIKPASTAPAATDPALVVAVSPNSWDVGSGTGGSKTQRVIVDSSQFSSAGQQPVNQATTVIQPTDKDFTVAVKDVSNGEYETVAASQTDQVLGATGAAGDWIEGLLIVPAAAAAGAVSIKDGSGSSISIFAGGGTTALPTLAPIYVPLGMKSTGGAWKVTTGPNVSVIGIGNFT